MRDVRTLIIGSSYLDSEFSVELARLWLRLARHLNPGMDIIVIDSFSPFDPRIVLPEVEVFRFPDNIGPISRGQRDGAGRALCKGIEIAIERGYDYCVHFELDFLFAKAIGPIIAQMDRAGVAVASPGLANPYQFLEFGIAFFSVPYLVARNFVRIYDWERAPVIPIVEMRLEHLFGSDLFLLPLRGVRNDYNQINAATMVHATTWPYAAPSWLTHIKDMTLAHQLLELNGIVLPQDGGPA